MICEIFNGQFFTFYKEKLGHYSSKNSINRQKMRGLIGIMESNIELMPKLVYAF